MLPKGSDKLWLIRAGMYSTEDWLNNDDLFCPWDKSILSQMILVKDSDPSSQDKSLCSNKDNACKSLSQVTKLG